MPESATKQAAVQTTIEHAGPSRKKIHLTVPAAVVDRRYRETFDRAAKQIRLPGFRPGHVPRSLVEKRFGDGLRKELVEHVVNSAIDEALRANEFVPLGQIDLDLQDKLPERGADYTFSFELDLRPRPVVENYTGLAVEPPSIAVAPEEIEEQLTQLCQQAAFPEKIEDENEGLPESGTFKARVVFTCDGETIHEVEEVHLAAAHPIKGCEELAYKNALAGAKPGQTAKVEITFQEGFPIESAVGKQGAVELHVKETFRTIVPTPEQLAERVNMSDVGAVRAEIERQLELMKAQMRDQELDRQILEHLLRNADFELPEKLIQEEVKGRVEKAEKELLEQGMDEQAAKEQVAQQLPATEQGAREYWTALFLKESIARQERIGVSEKEIRRELEQIAQRNRTSLEEVQTYYRENNLLGVLQHDLRDRKVRQLLREKATASGANAPAPGA
ncbi:MAG: trigger factor [Planctomycetes bacterium]|nr:trigger factor [Planctomycetota bacterium]